MSCRDEPTAPSALGSALQLMGVERVGALGGGGASALNGGTPPAPAAPPERAERPDEPPRKRAKLPAPDDAPALRRRILECELQRLRNLRERFTEQLSELYFLQAGGNMMDYAVWRKRPPAPQLVAFLEARRPAAVAAPASPPPAPAPPPAAPPPPAPAASPADEMVEKAKQEAYVAARVAELARAGLWPERRLPRVLEPPRAKSHWDYLLEEMAWLAQDFAHERKWKKQAAKKCARAVQKYFQDKALAAQKAEKAQELQLKKIAAFAAKEIRTFWSNVEKLVEWKRVRRVERARKEALDEQLSYIVDKTERYSRQLAANLHAPAPLAPPSDDDFTPRDCSTDDEETIAVADREDAEEVDLFPNEIETLTREGDCDLGDLLPPEYFDAPLAPKSPHSDYGPEREETDDERTIAEEEQIEDHDPAAELAELRHDADLGLDELRRRYADAPPPRPPSPSDNEVDADDESDTDADSDSAVTQSDAGDSTASSEALEALMEEHSAAGAEAEAGADAGAGQERRVEAAAVLAASLQPTGTTLSETAVATPVPRLLRHVLREYQHVGLHWLATMYARGLNGILADEMGLGKTVQTIALLAHLALERRDWGPHLVVAPTSVVLNWEMEFKKWCPAFKILTYYGTIKERKLKRVGWTKANSFHVCITSYKLVVQDHQSFRRKRWKYLILDEAQNIKNFKSQRWQMLLNFQTERRLLLTGTPLQNSLLELWSLMHFLMPDVFASHSEFREWFSEVAGIADGSNRYNEALVRRLHEVLRPFLLRRLKADVERQMPRKYEHVLLCRLSKRQRFLYDDFMSRAKTKESLASGHLLSVINVLMQLRKVCNHPDLFEPRPVSSPLQLVGLRVAAPALVLGCGLGERIELAARLGGDLASLELSGAGAFAAHRARHLAPPRRLVEELGERRRAAPRAPPASLRLHLRLVPRAAPVPPGAAPAPAPAARPAAAPAPPPARAPAGAAARLEARRRACLRRLANANERRCWRLPLLGADLRAAVHAGPPPLPPRDLTDMLHDLRDLIDRFCVCWQAARATSPQLVLGGGWAARGWRRSSARLEAGAAPVARRLLALLHAPASRQAVAFPHPSLLQYDCGKLQTLDGLLRRLKAGGHRVLIFTQMTRVLDVLEAFLSMHGYAYLRLDGATRVDRRQPLVDRFNADPRVFAFILSTRSGGVGLNLTGADSVVFYDSDWNPTMDAQAQDRCHRIGQTRDVHVYRLVTAATVEENILRKAEQKRALGHLAIEDGHFTTSYLRGANIKELFGSEAESNEARVSPDETECAAGGELESALAAAEDEADAAAAQAARAEAQGDLAEFDETLPLDDEAAAPRADADDLAALMNQLTPIEKYAMRLVESSEAATEAERCALGEMRRQLREWEEARRQLRSEQAPHSPPPAEPDPELTYSREDARAQIWVSTNGSIERMPMWCPPTPPSGDGDVYCDSWARALYRRGPAPDCLLPAVRSREPRQPREPRRARALPRAPHAPLSLFERAGARPRPRVRPPPHAPHPHPHAPQPDWAPGEDAALRRALRLQRLPPEPPAALQPNWDWAAELVGGAARAYRSPRACRDRHDALADPERARRRHRRPPAARRRLDDDAPRPPLARLDAMREAAERRRAQPRRRHDDSKHQNSKQAALLVELGLDYDAPPSPMDVASRRADRIAKEKLKAGAGLAAAPAAPAPAPQRIVVAAPGGKAEARRARPPGAADLRAPAPPAPATSQAPQQLLYRQQTFPARHLKILHQTTATHAQGGGQASSSGAEGAPALRKLQLQQLGVRRAPAPAPAAGGGAAGGAAGGAPAPGGAPPRLLAAGARLPHSHVVVAHLAPPTERPRAPDNRQ